MSISSKRQIVHLLRSIVHANRLPVRDRHRLRGSLTARSRVVELATNYLAQLQTTGNGREWGGPTNSALNRLVGELRAMAGDDIVCDSRLRAVERLLRIGGYDFTPQHDDPVDVYIKSLIEPQVTKPVEQPKSYAAPPDNESIEEKIARWSAS